MSKIGEKILRGTATVALLMGLVKAVGFFEKVVIADLFGTQFEADAYTVAFKSVLFTLFIIPQKLLAPFLPIFAEVRENDGETDAWRFASSVGTVIVLVMGSFAVCCYVFAPQISGWVSDFDNSLATDLTASLVRIMLPASILMAAFAFATLLCHSHKQFVFPPVGEILNKAAMLIAVLLLHDRLGVGGLAVGVVLGSALCLLVPLAGLGSKLAQLVPRLDLRSPAMRRLGRLILPILLGIAVAQLRTILDFRFASGMGEGRVSSLGYAKGLSDVAMLLGPFALGVVIYPYLSDLVAQKDWKALTAMLTGSMRMVTFLLIPASIGLVLLREPCVRLAFERGEFNADSVALTVQPLFYYGMGLTVFAVEIVLMRFYFAMKDTLTPTIVGILCVAVHVAIIYAFRETMMHASMALAAVGSKSVKIVILGILLRRKLSGVEFGRNAVFLLKTMLAAAAMGVAVYYANAALAGVIPVESAMSTLSRAMRLCLRLGACAVLGATVFAVASTILRVDEANLIWQRVSSRRRRNGQAH